MITKFKIFESDHYDIDPYGEEDWDLLDIGNKIKILPKIKEYVDKGDWGKHFLNYIGRTAEIIGIVTNSIKIECYIIEPFKDSPKMFNSLYIPKECVEKIE